jgi:hypothetical protein
MLTPMATQRLLFVVRRGDQRVVEERLVQISKIQPVLLEVSEALGFVPNNFHEAICSYVLVACQNFVATKKLRPALGGELAARDPVWDGEGWGCDRVA